MTDFLSSVDTVPRVFESAAGLPPDSRRDGEPKGKGRAQDRTQDRAQDCAQDCKVEEPLTFGETGWVPASSPHVHAMMTLTALMQPSVP